MLLLLCSDAAGLIRVQAEVMRQGNDIIGLESVQIGRSHEHGSAGGLESWRPDSKGCGFRDPIRRVRVDGRQIRQHLFPDSGNPGSVWTGPKLHPSLPYVPLEQCVDRLE